MNRLCKCGKDERHHDKDRLLEMYKIDPDIEPEWVISNFLAKHEFLPMTCRTCGKDLDLTLDEYGYKRNYYCREHCPKHKWQSNIDWPTECKHCGIHYVKYLEGLLEDNNIKFDKYK